jgi:hypothetical protein
MAKEIKFEITFKMTYKDLSHFFAILTALI